MHQEPGHTWVGSALTGQRLQEPALLGVPMYEAHRSWQLPGQCRAAIIMYAARNRIRLSPILLAAWAGPSLRRAVTAHLMAFEPRAAGKGLRQARAYLLPTTLARPMALSATCAGVAWLPCHSCTGSLRAKPILQYLGGWLGVGPISRVVGVNGGRASRSGAQPQASTERMSTRRSAPLTPMQCSRLSAGCRDALPPAPLPFGENGVPRGSASWSRPQAAKTERARLASSSGLIYDPDGPLGYNWGYFQRFPRGLWRAFPAKLSAPGPLPTDQRLKGEFNAEGQHLQPRPNRCFSLLARGTCFSSLSHTRSPPSPAGFFSWVHAASPLCGGRFECGLRSTKAWVRRRLSGTRCANMDA